MPRRKRPTKFTASVGHRIAELRREKGLTLAHIGAGDGDERDLRGHMSNIEHGRVNPTLFILSRIADNMGLDLPYLVCQPGASRRQALIERTRYLSDAEVERLLVELGPVPVLAPRSIKRARSRPLKRAS